MDPLVPPEVDLRNFTYMPLDVVRLRDSDIAGVEDGEVFRAAVLAWCAAWHQVPAASLPDDDALLARLTGYGRDMVTWRRVREAGALRGFVRCSDGRLYHPVVAEKALEAWDKKGRQAERTRRATEAAAERARVRRESVTESVTDSKERRGVERNREERDIGDVPLSSGGSGGTRAERADRGTRLPADWVPTEPRRRGRPRGGQLPRLLAREARRGRAEDQLVGNLAQLGAPDIGKEAGQWHRISISVPQRVYRSR